MKVIIANYRYFVAGGPEKYMFKFTEAARQRGIEVIPFSVNHPQNEPTPYSRYFVTPRADALMYEDTKLSVRNLRGALRATVYNFEAERKLRKLIREERPDVIYILHEVNHLSPSIIRAAKKEHVPVIHRISDFFMFCARYDFLDGDRICEACIHGNYSRAVKNRCVKGSLPATLLRVSAMKLYDRMKIFDDVDLFVVPSAFTAEKLREGGTDAKKIRLIPTFIDNSGITPYYDNRKYFLFLGRMTHQKGVMVAIRAMSGLKDTGFVLKITGTLSDTEEDRRIRQYVEEYGISDTVRFVGFTQGKELEALIRGAVCIVCPSIWYENMPNTVIEAYAYGKPVVASRLGSLAEMVEDGVTGLLFRPGDAEDLAEKLSRFAADDGLGAALGRNARRKCETEYGKELHMDWWMESVRQLTDESCRPARRKRETGDGGMKKSAGVSFPERVIFAVGIRGGFSFLGSGSFLRLMYRCRNGTRLNLDEPVTFNEKLQWLKLHDHNPVYPVWVDKYTAKQYVADCIGEEYVIPTYGVWDCFEDIDFSALPETFVLKCTHDCGGVSICRGRDSWDRDAAGRMIRASLKKNYYRVGREWPYRDIPPRVLAEQYIESGDHPDESLTDYKVHVFSGVPRVILVCSNRFSPQGMNEDFFDCEWNHLDIRRRKYPNRADTVPKPAHLEQMLSAAAKLSGNVPFVRVDFYEADGRLLFGEMTLYPASGFEPFLPEGADEWLGKLLTL